LSGVDNNHIRSGAGVITQQAAFAARVTIYSAIVLVAVAMPVVKPELDYAYGELKVLVLHSSSLLLVGALVYSSYKWWRARSSDFIDVIITPRAFAHSPVLIIISGLLLMLLAASISTLLSPLPKVSFFGVYEEYSGFNLYDGIAFSVLLVGAAISLRSYNNLVQLLIVIAGVGVAVSIYGIAQHFGWDALGHREDSGRIPSSFGNTLNFGAFLVLALPATASLVIHKRITKHWHLLVLGFAIGVQIAALWFTGGRGPLIGSLFGLFAVIGVLRTMSSNGLGRAAVLTIVVGIAVAVVLIVIPSDKGVDTLGRVSAIDRELSALDGEQVSIGAGGLAARQEIWRNSVSLFLNPETPKDENPVLTHARRIIGLGPDMFVHSYSLVAKPIPGIMLQANAHNLALHILVTIGVLGLTGLAIMCAGTLLLFKKAFFMARGVKDRKDQTSVLVAILIVIAIGKSIEMTVGIPRVSDLLPTFAVIGGIVAGGTLLSRRASDLVVNSGQSQFRASDTKLVFRPSYLFGVTTAFLIVSSVVFVSWDMRRFDGTLNVVAAGSDPKSLGDAFLRAREDAPDRLFFTTELVKVFVDTAVEKISQGNIEEGLNLLERGREFLLEYEAYNPNEFTSQLSLAKLNFLLVQHGATEYKDEMIAGYRRLAETNPAYPTVIGTAATAAASVEEYKLAVDLANRAIATEEQTKNWSKAWLARGVSRYYLGDTDGGINDLLTAVEKEPASQSAYQAHQALIQFYTELGHVDSAEYHRTKIGK